MNDQGKTKEQLIVELSLLRDRIAELEKAAIGGDETVEELPQRRISLRQVIDTIPYPIFVKDTHNRYLFSNQSLADAYGTTAERMIGKTDSDLGAVPDEAEKYRHDNMAVLQAGREMIIENDKFTRPSGEVRYYQKIKRPVWDNQGNLMHMIAISVDITDRKRVEDALRKSEEQFRVMFASASVGMGQSDPDTGRFLRVNQKMCDITGYSADELLQLHIPDITHPEDRDRDWLAFQSVVCGEVPSYRMEKRYIRKDGNVVWVNVNVSVNRDDAGRPLHSIATIEDITERKRAEMELKESEERFRLLHEASFGGIFIYQNGVIVEANRGLAVMTGYELPELIGMDGLQLVAPESRELVLKNVREDYEKPYEAVGLRKDGSTYPLEIQGKKIPYHGRKVRMTEFRDITAQKQEQEERRRLEFQLLQAQKMESVGTLAGGIAHDFNNMLMGIQGYVSLMLLDTDKNHPHHEKLKSVENQIRSAADLTRQLLGFARGGRYEIKPADLNEIIKRTSGMFGRTKKEITIHRKFDKNLWVAEVDQGQIEQVLLNLYVNAWQAMPSGGDLYIETLNVILDERYTAPFAAAPGSYVKISVTDTGVGMDEKTKSRIFEPFFTTKTMGRGTGLGLAMVYGIIVGHNGFINVYSEKGQGTTFNIYLPASEKRLEGEEEYPQVTLKGHETILVVDDEAMIRTVTAEMLKSLGYKPIAASSGGEALKIYESRRETIDLVVLDMVMPGMTGGETFDRLKAINGKIKVILSSGYSLNGQASGILEKGCRAFVQKPFSIVELSQKIRAVLDG